MLSVTFFIVMLTVNMLSVAFTYCDVECRYGELHYAKFRDLYCYAECHYTECR